MVHRALLVVAVVFGCSKDVPSPPPPQEPAAPRPVAIDAAPVNTPPPPVDASSPPDAATPPPDAAPSPPDAAVKPGRKVCKADANHCCMPNGTVVRTSGCDPLDGGHGMDRGADGKCRESFCRCLPGDAAIATPHGDVAIDQLHVGDLVWTADASGLRVAAPIVKLASVPFSAAHTVREVTLDDGRVFRASSGHPLVDGSLVGALRVGAVVDAARVSAIRTLTITGPTWDLLPAGDTGTYWADGTRLGSTLR